MRKSMLFLDPVTLKHKVMKYSRKERDYVTLFEGTRNECVSFMMNAHNRK